MNPHDAQSAADHAPAAETFDAGSTIIGHVSNSGIEHPLIHLPPIFGIDFSVTKHVFMLWVVAAIVAVVVIALVRRFVRQQSPVPGRGMSALELMIEFVRDSIVLPNIGRKWAAVWTPMLLSLFLFILFANAIGLVPIFDVLALVNHYVLHASPESFVSKVTHGGTTATGNYNVTAGLAMISFFAVIVAGTRAHGFAGHWKNLMPGGVPKALAVALIPIEVMGMLVRPFALTMRLAANMTGGHIAILSILSFVFIFTETMGPAGGMGVGALFSVPLAAAISMLEIIVVLVQAYVFTLLSAVFIGMAIHAHH